MPIRRNSDTGRTAVALLATALVVFSGAVATAFIVLATAERATWIDWTVWSGLIFGVIAFLFALRSKPDRDHLAWAWLWQWRRGNKESGEEYIPQYQLPKRKSAPNQPPTVEAIRELSEQSGNVLWVPRGNAPNRPHQKK